MKTIGLLLFTAMLSIPMLAQSQADLLITEVEPPEWDDVTRIFIHVKNDGNKVSEATKIKVWDLDINVKEAKKLGFRKSDMWIFEENVARAEGDGYDYDEDWEVKLEVPSLEPGESIEIEVNLAHWIYDSNCEIGVIIDCDDQIEEKNEKNNKFYFAAGG